MSSRSQREDHRTANRVPGTTLITRSLTGRVALVTGAAKGIGAGIAKAMAAAGASVVVNFATDRPGAERVVADIKAAGGNAFAIQANVSVVAEVEHLCAEAVAKFGTLDILVNNASVFAFASLEQTTDEQLHKMLDTNLGHDYHVPRSIEAFRQQRR